MNSDARFYGVYRARVAESQDPVSRGRVKVVAPNLFGPEMFWARLATAVGANEIATAPAIGDEVLIAFEAGDASLPFVIGVLWKEGAPPASHDAARSDAAVGGMKRIYKIVSAREWRAAEAAGVFLGAAIDLTDGFIHFSSADQVEETAAKHFAGQTDLLLVSIDAHRLGDALKWEVSRGGALFPHLYAPLSLDAVARVDPLPLGQDGRHDFSGLFA